MFYALGQDMDGDHLDLSFRDTSRWPRVGPSEGMPPSLWLSLGDPNSGPAIQLGCCQPPPQAMWLDTHYHASDQFRAVVQGDFQLQRKHMRAGDFGYQQSGIPYREGFPDGGTEDLWMFAVHGNRRGARSTLTRSDGTFLLPEVGEDQLDRPVDSPDSRYWDTVPGGAKGMVALVTNAGPVRGGFSWGSFEDTGSWQSLTEGVRATAGLLSDRKAGPIILTLQAEADRVVAPAATFATEIVLAILDGSCTVGSQHYHRGDVRVQKAGAPIDLIASGDGGLNAVLLIADRSAGRDIAARDLDWAQSLDRIVGQLSETLAA